MCVCVCVPFPPVPAPLVCACVCGGRMTVMWAVCLHTQLQQGPPHSSSRGLGGASVTAVALPTHLPCAHPPRSRMAGTELLQRLKAHWAAQSHDAASSQAAAAAEGAEGAAHAHHGPGPLPMFTSCCPAWVNLVEKVGAGWLVGWLVQVLVEKLGHWLCGSGWGAWIPDPPLFRQDGPLCCMERVAGLSGPAFLYTYRLRLPHLTPPPLKPAHPCPYSDLPGAHPPPQVGPAAC